jgi:hypothetical protein
MGRHQLRRKGRRSRGVDVEEWKARKKEMGGGQEQNVFEMRRKAWKSPNVSCYSMLLIVFTHLQIARAPRAAGLQEILSAIS